MSNSGDHNYFAVMLIDDNEIDNLIKSEKIIEAASITRHIYTHTGARSAIEFLKNVEKLEDIAGKILPVCDISGY
ncbi:MAG: hypothetical protein U5K79_04135 [Cyclobacteriaceae bacterium]|nr:hypothetical protein [Cyclobacteriaceae bacterium]